MSICPRVRTLGDTTESIKIQLPLEGCELVGKEEVEGKERGLESEKKLKREGNSQTIDLTHLGMPKVSRQYITNKSIIIPNSKCITLG